MPGLNQSDIDTYGTFSILSGSEIHLLKDPLEETPPMLDWLFQS